MNFRARLSVTVVAAIAIAGFAAGGAVSPAHAAAGVSVAVEGDPSKTAVADPSYVTQLRLNGSGFQSIKNGYGGIYVAFGWVSGDGWRPSQGGTTGTNYRYVPDDESSPTGYLSFVAFPGSSTAASANGGELHGDGTWSTVLTVPGAKFTSQDRSGNPSEVNCLEVQCGIITIGAHGLKNANNETFTPISFRDLYAQGGAPAAPAPGVSASSTPTPAPTRTVIVDESASPAPSTTALTAPENASSSSHQLATILLWIAAGVGVLAVGAIAFLVWAVLSSRKRQRASAAAAGGETTP